MSVLALDGLFDTGLTVILDALTLANKFSARQMGGTPHFDLSIIGVRKKVRSSLGLVIPVRAVTADLKPDWVIVPALSTGMPEQFGGWRRCFGNATRMSCSTSLACLCRQI